MSHIAIIITDDFEDSEYTAPAKAFMEAGHKLTHIGLQADSTVKGKKEKTPVKIDRAVRQARVEDFDALLIPGGYSPDKLRVDADAVRFAGQFMESGKPVFSICHGPQLLITARSLKGRKATGYTSIAEDMRNAGAEYLDQQVVVDGNLVTSRHPGDIPAFVDASLKKLH
jgi:protease I